jgi:hypothetical protein
MHEAHENGYLPADNAEVYANELAGDDDGPRPRGIVVDGPYASSGVE